MDARDLRLFLASPGGLEEYRSAARRSAEAVRRGLADPIDVGFDLVGWEDLPPGFGRPQGRINPSLDRCNVLIGILGRRLGSPTGEAESGFVEEFERMAARAEAGEDVEILVYMIELSRDDLEDPGDMLKEVIEFRERLRGEVLFKSVRNPDHFAAELTADLLTLLAPALEHPGAGAEGTGSQAPEEGAPQAEMPEPGGDGPAAAQLRMLLEEAAASAPGIPGRFGTETLPVARLAIWLSTWQSWYFDNQIFDHHILNRLYRVRGDVVLGPLERRQVLRSMCAGPTLSPGWALLGEDPQAIPSDLVALGVADGEDATVRVGAWNQLDPELLRDWFGREDVEIDESHFFEHILALAGEVVEPVRLAMIGLAQRAGGEAARRFLGALRERGESGDQALSSLICIEADVDPAAAFAFASEAERDLGEEALTALRAVAGQVSREVLESLAADSPSALRSLAIELLGERGEEAAPALRRLVQDPEDSVAAAAFSALTGLSDPGIDLVEVGSEMAGREGLRFDPNLRREAARGRPAEELRSEVSWPKIETAGVYRALAEDHFEEFGEVVRRDLGDGFDAFAAESRERLLETLPAEARDAIEKAEFERVVVHGQTQTEVSKTLADFRRYLEGGEWNERSFAMAALAGIAANGEAIDAALVRPFLGAEDAGVKEAAARALARVGEEADVGRLVELAQGLDGELFAGAAIAISPGPEGAARPLLDSSRGATATLAARHLVAQASELDEATVEELLHHGIDAVRRVGVAAVLIRVGEDEAALIALLDRYLAAGSYFYDVVCLLDRVIYAPALTALRTRVEVAAFAAEREAPRKRRRDSRLWRALRDTAVEPRTD
jgi:HEAT repeat protein